MTSSRLAPLAGALASLAFAASASATPGDPDPAFAGSGTTTLDFGEVTVSSVSRPSTDKATSSAIQADGKTVVAGSTNVGDGDLDLAIARFNTDGSLDTTFGENGRVVTDFGADEQISAIAVTSNGEIVATGSSTRDKGVIVLAKYTEDGSLDPSFGQGGRVVTSFGDHPYGQARGAAVLLQPSGDIIVGGSVAAGSGVVEFALPRTAKLIRPLAPMAGLPSA